MALKANRTAAPQVEGTQEQDTQATGHQAPAAPPAQRQAPAAPANPSSLANLNAGILDNIEDMNVGGNYVTIDGSEFLYKATNETTKELRIQIHYGKRFYQWVDESIEPKQFHNSPTKLDDRYKLKFEIRWNELVDDEPQEHIMSLSTTSAIQFINYVQSLAKSGYAVNQVETIVTISRQQRPNSSDRYSRAEFKMGEVYA